VSRNAVNVLVVLAIAAAVFAIPGGGDTADLVLALLSTLILMSFIAFGWRMYRENRIALYSLGDTHRGLLYAGIGGIIFALAGRVRLLETGAGSLLWFAVVAGAILAFYRVWAYWRAESAY
jgi:hypothetical protein